MAKAYCMKYGKKVAIENSKQVTLRNNSLAVQGVCPDCGTKGVSNGESLSSPEIKDAPLNKSSKCSLAKSLNENRPSYLKHQLLGSMGIAGGHGTTVY